MRRRTELSEVELTEHRGLRHVDRDERPSLVGRACHPDRGRDRGRDRGAADGRCTGAQLQRMADRGRTIRPLWDERDERHLRRHSRPRAWRRCAWRAVFDRPSRCTSSTSALTPSERNVFRAAVPVSRPRSGRSPKGASSSAGSCPQRQPQAQCTPETRARLSPWSNGQCLSPRCWTLCESAGGRRVWVRRLPARQS